MARYKEPVITAAFAPQLQPGETLRSAAYGVKQPSIAAMIPLYLLGILPGVIAVAILTKEYLVGLTDRRVLVLRVSGGKAEVQEVTEYGLDERPPVTASQGSLFAHVAITDPARPFKAKFHRAGYPNNREHAISAAQALGATVA